MNPPWPNTCDNTRVHRHKTWRTFLTNHANQIMAADFYVVPTVTFRLLFVLISLAHDHRRIVHAYYNDVSYCPTSLCA